MAALLASGLLLDAAQTQTNEAQSRALELLRKTIAEREGRPATVATSTMPAAPQAVRPRSAIVAPAQSAPVPPELERQYLEGKITAKQFQKLLEEWKRSPPRPTPVATNDPRVLEALRQRNPLTAPPATSVQKPLRPPAEPQRGAAALGPRIVPSDPPKAPEPPPISPAVQSQLSEVEKKMDELMRQKAEREKSQTNAVPSEPAKPKTKRERLDDLLRQLINGKITDAEYKEQREKVISGPD